MPPRRHPRAQGAGPAGVSRSDQPGPGDHGGRLGESGRLRTAPPVPARSRPADARGATTSARCSCSRPRTSGTPPPPRSATGPSTRASAGPWSPARAVPGSGTSARRRRRTACSSRTCTTPRTRSGATPGLQGAIGPETGLHARAAREIKAALGGGRRGRGEAGGRPRRDRGLPRAPGGGPEGRRRPAGDDAGPRDQEPRRDRPPDPGLRDGRRRLSRHLRDAEARDPRVRRRGAGPQPPVRDGLGVRRGHQLDRRRTVQPAPARVQRSADPAGGPGVLRHHPRLQRLSHLLLPHLRRRARATQAQRDAFKQSREWMDSGHRPW